MDEIMRTMKSFESSIQKLDDALSPPVVHSRFPRGLDFPPQNLVRASNLTKNIFRQPKCTHCAESGTTCDVPSTGPGTCKQCFDDVVVCSQYVFFVP